MTIYSSLPPHLEEFIRDQLATGRYQSESEVIHTALHLLEEQSQSPAATHAWLKQELDQGLSSKPSEPVTKQFWDQLRAGLTGNPGTGNDP